MTTHACICDSPDGHHDLYCWGQFFAADPMTNPPNRPIPPHTPVRPTWAEEQRMQAEYDSHFNKCGGCIRCEGVA